MALWVPGKFPVEGILGFFQSLGLLYGCTLRENHFLGERGHVVKIKRFLLVVYRTGCQGGDREESDSSSWLRGLELERQV